MGQGAAGAGEFPVNLQGGLVGAVAHFRVEIIVLREVDAELLVHMGRIRGAHIDLEIHQTAFHAVQPEFTPGDIHIPVHCLMSAVCFDLPDRRLVQASVFDGKFPGQAHLSEPGDVRGVQVAVVPVLHPADHDAAAVGGEHGLGRVEIKTVVHGLIKLLREGLGLIVPGPDHAEGAVAVVVLETLWQHVLGAGQQHLLSVQLEEIRALPHETQTEVVLHQGLHKRPVNGIVAPVQKHLPAVANMIIRQEHPVGSIRLLPGLRIAECGPVPALGQIPLRENGISGVFGVEKSVSEGQILNLELRDVSVRAELGDHAGIDQHMAAVGQGESVPGEAAVPVIGLVRRHGHRQVLPLQQVLRDRVAPVHGSPVGVVGMILVEHVILPVVQGEPVRIIHPAYPGGKMERGPGFRRDGLLFFFFVDPGISQNLAVDRHSFRFPFCIFGIPCPGCR